MFALYPHFAAVPTATAAKTTYRSADISFTMAREMRNCISRASIITPSPNMRDLLCRFSTWAYCSMLTAGALQTPPRVVCRNGKRNAPDRIIHLTAFRRASSRVDPPNPPKPTAQPTSELYEQIYLVPFLKESGTPVACMSEFWPHVMRDECMNDPGVPFRAELPLTLAIWGDGTVIWQVSSTEGRPEYYEAEVPKEATSKLLARIDLTESMMARNVRYSDEAISRYCPASVIMISQGKGRLFLCSQLGAMESLQEYWVWEDLKQRTFPFSKYSFEDYCRHLPEAYRQHLRDFVRVRSQLRATLPAKGRRITVGDRVQWMAVTVAPPSRVSPNHRTNRPQSPTDNP